MGTGGKIAIGCGIAALVAVGVFAVTAVGQAYDQAAEQMEKAAGTVTAGDEASREALEKGSKDLKDQADDAREAAQSLDVPAANIELFRKHEAELKKYAMSGLEWIGL